MPVLIARFCLRVYSGRSPRHISARALQSQAAPPVGCCSAVRVHLSLAASDQVGSRRTGAPGRHGSTIRRQGMPSNEGRRQRRKAPAQLGPAAACRPARTPCRPPTPPAAAAAPCAPSRGRSKLQRRPSELARRPTSPCCASPARALASARYRRARRAHKRRLNPSSEPAGGSLLPPPPPPAQGAAAPSSLVHWLPVISTSLILPRPGRGNSGGL